MVDTLCSTSSAATNDTTTNLMNLNQLFIELKNNLLSSVERNKMNLNHNHQHPTPVPAVNDNHNRRHHRGVKAAPIIRTSTPKNTNENNNVRNFRQKETSQNGSTIRVNSGEEVVGKLNSLMGDLETSFSSLLKSNPSVSDSSDNDEAFVEVAASPNERYVLDDFSQFLYRKYAISSKDSLKPIKPPRRMSDSRLSDLQRRRRARHNSSSSSTSSLESDGMLHNISQHSTLCRRLKTLEASFGLTLKKQLQSVILKRMRDMNVSGCVYCLYALYVSIKMYC